MTSTLQLTRYDSEDGIEILINSITGESFCSVKGYARMSGISKSVITRRLREVTDSIGGVRKSSIIPLNPLMIAGYKGVRKTIE